METSSTAVFVESSPPPPMPDDDLSDLCNEALVLPSPAPAHPKKRRTKPRRSKQSDFPYDHHHPNAAEVEALDAVEHAAAGAALAGVMAGALGTPPACKSKEWGVVVKTCAVLGIGALYIGLLVYIWKRASAMEGELQKTADELRKIAAYLESSEGLPNEPPPPRPGPISLEAGAPPISAGADPEDLENDDTHDKNTPSLPLPVKRRKPAASSAKTLVVNLDLDAEVSSPSAASAASAAAEAAT